MTNKVMSIKIKQLMGGLKMKKFSIILALALAVIMTMGISTAFAAGENDYLSYGADEYDSVTNKAYSDALGRNQSGNELESFGTTPRNANKTGLAPLTGNRPLGGSGYGGKQLVHGEYKKNTNSCAACHITHNAAGAKLLFKSSVYNTCTSCHDGSFGGATGSYNVLIDGASMQTKMEGTTVDGKLENGKQYVAGTFRGDVNKGSSMHLTTAGMKNSAAPGGNRDVTAPLSTDKSLAAYMAKSSWAADFTCASCHAPHGSYSSRLLHYNPNFVGVRPASDGGKLKPGATVVAATYADLVDLGAAADATDGLGNIKADYVGKIYVAKDGTTLQKGPWLYGYNYHRDATPVTGKTGKVYWTYVYDSSVIQNAYDKEFNDKLATGAMQNENLDINYYKGYMVVKDGSTMPANAKVDIANAVSVKFNLDGSKKTLDYGTKGKVSDYCAACHTDYMQNGTASNDSGMFSSAKRHNINKGTFAGMAASSANMECLSCHFAHGTTAEIMLDAKNEFLPAGEVDLNPSSALKRYVNQGVCFRCHTSSAASTLKNTNSFWDGTGDGKAVYKTLGE